MSNVKTPAETRAASLVKVMQAVSATSFAVPGEARRQMVAYARSIRLMVEVSEMGMARDLTDDLAKIVTDTDVPAGWRTVLDRRLTELRQVI